MQPFGQSAERPVGRFLRWRESHPRPPENDPRRSAFGAAAEVAPWRPPLSVYHASAERAGGPPFGGQGAVHATVIQVSSASMTLPPFSLSIACSAITSPEVAEITMVPAATP